MTININGFFYFVFVKGISRDKFDVFVEWLLANGGSFPGLELRVRRFYGSEVQHR